MLQNQTFSLNCNGRLVELSAPKIMGILNLTPDSFSDGGRFNNEKAALAQTEKMIAEGADIIDIGPQSTRPGAQYLSADQEIERLGSLIRTLKTHFPQTLISIDTFWGKTVAFAHDQGADIVNDISAGQFDPELIPQVIQSGLPYILMHSNASHQTMHHQIKYEAIALSVNRFLLDKASELLKLGLKDLILDPGFGFGKTIEDQYTLLENTRQIGWGRFPVLIGISRKSFIYKPLNKTPNDIVEETQKLHLKALSQGAKILRVHDVKETKATINYWKTTLQSQ
ncbi:dihydropteroate synthase [Bergeyella sp. RCAD1439]|uniref:dihydropteroate synthase n=1 Tax=Bergeyella anatis TaxID=3113737 RepID=UPI002E178BA8|nr:dihydropteroate synthase [Bergeyella sp. RCAD1439]